MTPVVAFGVSKTVVTDGGSSTMSAAVAPNVVALMASGSLTPISRRATAANTHASGDSDGIRGMDFRTEDTIGATTWRSTTLTGEGRGFGGTGWASTDVAGVVSLSAEVVVGASGLS